MVCVCVHVCVRVRVHADLMHAGSTMRPLSSKPLPSASSAMFAEVGAGYETRSTGEYVPTVECSAAVDVTA